MNFTRNPKYTITIITILVVFILQLHYLFSNIHVAYSPIGIHNLEGYVFDAMTGHPLVGAKVVITDIGCCLYTDQFGFYYATVEPGYHNLAVEASWHRPQMAGVDVPQLGSGVARKDFYLEREKTAVLVDPGYAEVPNDGLLNNIASYLNYAGYEVSEIRKGCDVTIEWLKTGLSHAIVFLRGHGTKGVEYPEDWAFWTAEPVTDETMTKYHDDFVYGRICISTDNYWGITPTFIQYYYGQEGTLNKIMLVYIESCYSLKFDGPSSMAGVFIECGAEAVVGYREWISPRWSGDADVQQFFYDLCHRGYSVGKAARVKQSYDPFSSRDCFARDELWAFGEELTLINEATNTRSLGIIAHSPVEIYVTDPLERHIGIDPITGDLVVEVPNATYVGGPELNQSAPRSIWIPEIVNGSYEITLVGIYEGEYNLTATVYDLFTNNTDQKYGNISKNQTVCFVANVHGCNITVIPLHEIAICNITLSNYYPTINETITIMVTVLNLGNSTEAFELSLNYTRLRDPLIGTEVVTLLPGETMTLNFNWTPNMPGRYQIIAYTSVMPEDMDPNNNSMEIIVYVVPRTTSDRASGTSFRKCFLK